jgi:hypothetical protein
MTIKTDNYQVGASGTASQNFTLRTGNDGSFKVSRGEPGATTSDVLTVSATGEVTGNIIAGVGVGQTLQSLTGSRSMGTVFTNTTGRPILVHVRITSTIGSSMNCSVGGATITGQFQASTAQGMVNSVIVPTGATYAFNVSAGTPTILEWVELR